MLSSKPNGIFADLPASSSVVGMEDSVESFRRQSKRPEADARLPRHPSLAAPSPFTRQRRPFPQHPMFKTQTNRTAGQR